MSDKLNENAEFDENKNALGENSETLDPPQPKLEENDNWEFDGVAHTLDDTLIENDEFEILIPKKESVSETRERPVAVKPAEEKKAPAPKTDNKNSTKFLLMAIFIVIVAGILTFFGIRYYTLPNTEEVLNPGNVAATIGDTDITIGMYNYYYNNIVNYYKQQASYGYVELDTTQSFKNQKTTDADGKKITWEKRFQNETIDQLKRLVAYYESAEKDGIELTDEQNKMIKEDIETIKTSAEKDGTPVEDYIKVNFGDYCGLNTVKKMEKMSYVAQTYLRKATIEMVPDDERVQKYYDEHKEDYQQVEMCYLVMQYDENNKADQIKKAKKYASEIKNEKQLKKLIPVVCKDLIDAYVEQGTYGDADAVAEQISSSSTMTVTKSNPNQLPQAIIDFLFDENNKKGACRTVADDDYKAVFIVLKNSDVGVHDEQVYSVRHILIMPESDKADDDDNTETAEPTKEQWNAAMEKANKILTEYNSGKRSEYEFAKLAEKYSGDTASLSTGGSNYGGLYANTPLGQMVKEFEGWATDKNRTYGDVEIIKSQFGYHIMYFISNGPAYLSECKMAVQVEMEDEFVDSVKVKTHKGAMKKTTVAKPDTANDGNAANSAAEAAIQQQQAAESTTAAASEKATASDAESATDSQEDATEIVLD